MKKVRLFGFSFVVSDLNTFAQFLISRVKKGQHDKVLPTTLNEMAMAHKSKQLSSKLRAFDFLTMDGMPLVFLSKLKVGHEAKRIYGPDLMALIFSLGQKKNVKHYLYGGTQSSLTTLVKKLKQEFTKAHIVGQYSPPFRPLTSSEEKNIIEKIKKSQADIVWVGLGGEKQIEWIDTFFPRLQLTCIGVGAAFDFLAGVKPQAPVLLRNVGLEWLYRLVSEPKRLWRRYLLDIPVFLLMTIMVVVAKNFRRVAPFLFISLGAMAIFIFGLCVAIQTYSAQLYGNIRFSSDPSRSTALTPPMGWNGWNKFGCSPDLNENSFKEMVDKIVDTGLKDVGYTYVVLDDCWQVSRSENGEIEPDPARFPGGIKALAEYVHKKGLKFGIYTSGGRTTCEGRPGSYGFEKKDMQTYANWGVDFIKVDWCGIDHLDAPTQYGIWREAIDAQKKPIVLSIAMANIDRVENNYVWMWGSERGDMWRTAIDLQDNWQDMLRVMDKNSKYAEYSKPGGWNDADMLQVGNGGMSINEYKVHFSLWAMMSSPLIMGNDLRSMSNEVKSILTNKEIIAIDQDLLGIQAQRIKSNQGKEVWVKILAHKGTRAVALLNTTDKAQTMGFHLDDLQLNKIAYFKNLWEPAQRGFIWDSYSVVVPAHSVEVIKIKGFDSLENFATFPFQNNVIRSGNHSLADANHHFNIFPNREDENKIWFHKDSILSYNLGGNCTHFEGELKQADDGILDSVILKIYIDGNLVQSIDSSTPQTKENSFSIDTTRGRVLDFYLLPKRSFYEDVDGIYLENLRSNCQN